MKKVNIYIVEKWEKKKQTHVNTSASAWSIYGTRVRNPARMSDFVIHMTKFDAAAIAARRIWTPPPGAVKQRWNKSDNLWKD